MTRVKICGITNIEDALGAVDAGADALGFIFADCSPRYVPPETVREIVRALPPYVQTVGVFVGDDPHAQEIALDCGLNVLQLHSGYSAQFVRELGSLRLVLGIRVEGASSFDDVPGLERASAILLDTYVKGQEGGTGAVFDWSLAQQAHTLRKPIVLSGGLTPENVAEAVRQVRPYAVDVSSGVEAAPGRKDIGKVRLFIERVRNANGR